MSYYADCQTALAWHGCYTGQTALLTPDSVSHPAKMAPALVFRIFDHLAELGLLKPDDTVLDSMAGTGLTGLAWAAKGGRSVLVELEERFVGFIRENKAQLARSLGREVEIEVLQGDTRQLSELLGERGLKAVTSPPYLEAQGGSGLATGMRHRDGHSLVGSGYFISEHGTTPGQIGALPDKPLKAVTSPPYGDIAAQFRNTGSKLGGDRFQYGSDRETNIGNLADEADYDDETKAAWWRRKAASQQAETYLEAMRQVYAEIAKVADVLVVVTKNPTRAGKLRRLDLDTIVLLEDTGWEIHCQHRAILFEEQEQGDLFGGSKKQTKGRLSFFKRLSYQKGNAVAQWEDIIVATRSA